VCAENSIGEVDPKSLIVVAMEVEMLRCVSLTLVIPLVLAITNASAQELSAFRESANCIAPALPANADLLVINRESRGDHLADLPGWLRERSSGAVAKTYARETAGYFGPGN
jgi:hypothetical protein